MIVFCRRSFFIQNVGLCLCVKHCMSYHSKGFIFNLKKKNVPRYSSGATGMATKQVISKVYISFVLGFTLM